MKCKRCPRLKAWLERSTLSQVSRHTFIPLVEDERQLTRARPGEGNKPWSAGAGCGALATGLVEVAWVLQSVRRQLTQLSPPFLAWDQFASCGMGLFLWEAFVSGRAKGATHVADAEAGAKAFLEALPNPESRNAVVCNSPVYSLVGAALLRTGWSTNVNLLQESCLVLRPRENGSA